MEEDRILIGLDLSAASPLAIELLLEDASDPSLYEEIAKANMQRPEILQLILNSPDVPDEIRQQVAEVLSLPVIPKSEILKEKKPPEVRVETILQRIQKLKVSERIQIALKGGKDIRTILLRDANREVSLTVLDNPKITETEIELVARSRSMPEEMLRVIAKRKNWTKNYGIMHALATNPKTPIGIALAFISQLKTRDLQVLEKDRNIAEGIRATAKKLYKARKGV
jgi:hypothetical protein